MILKTTDEDLFLKAGMNALALSRIFDIGMQLFGMVALFNIPCLMYGFGKWSIIEVDTEENVYFGFMPFQYSFVHFWHISFCTSTIQISSSCVIVT